MNLGCTKFGVTFSETDEDFVMPPDMEFFGFKRSSYITNFKQLDLFATNAKFYDAREIIELYSNDTYTYEIDGTVASSATALFTTVHQKTLFTTFYTNVVIVFSNDSTLYTEYLEWDNEMEYFRTPEAVRIEQDNGNWLRGVGMEGNMGLEIVTIYDEVDEGDSFFEEDSSSNVNNGVSN